LLKEHDQSNDGVISWDEFCDMMVHFKGTDAGKFGDIVEGKGGAQAQIKSSFGGHH